MAIKCGSFTLEDGNDGGTYAVHEGGGGWSFGYGTYADGDFAMVWQDGNLKERVAVASPVEAGGVFERYSIYWL